MNDETTAALSPSARAKLGAAIKTILDELDDVDRESTADTPNRVMRMYDELLSGYAKRPDELIKAALFNVRYDEMVIVRDIDFYSLCEHHMMPFFGSAHVGYIPRDKIVGLSKIPRVVDAFARRLQVQERLTEQIARSISDGVNALGVGVVIQGSHMCAGMRGALKPNAKMVTSAMLGTFRTESKTRKEFLANINPVLAHA